jgi:hypothetical protein
MAAIATSQAAMAAIATVENAQGRHREVPLTAAAGRG